MTKEKDAEFIAEEIADFREAVHLSTEILCGKDWEGLQYGKLEQHLLISTSVLNAQIREIKNLLEQAPEHLIQMVNNRLPTLLKDVILVNLMGEGPADYGIVYRVCFGSEYKRLISDILSGAELPKGVRQLIADAEATQVARQRFQQLFSDFQKSREDQEHPG